MLWLRFARFALSSIGYDRGHRLFGVSSDAHEVVLNAIRIAGGPKKLITLETGRSRQTVLTDCLTVIHSLGNTRSIGNWQETNGTGISIRVADPLGYARKVVSFLEGRGFGARATDLAELLALPPNNIVIVASEAFPGWQIALTLPVRKLPRPSFR